MLQGLLAESFYVATGSRRRLSEELPAGGAPLAIKLLGEDLVLFRNEKGEPGLLDLHCAHRGTDLSYGRLEDGGIRCIYHGWLYDTGGRSHGGAGGRSRGDRLRSEDLHWSKIQDGKAYLRVSNFVMPNLSAVPKKIKGSGVFSRLLLRLSFCPKGEGVRAGYPPTALACRALETVIVPCPRDD